MINTLFISDKDFDNNEFTLGTGKYNDSYFENPAIFQKVRLGKNVDGKLNSIYSSTFMSNAGDEFAFVKSYEVTSPCMISNSYNNMNITLMNFFSKNKKVMKNHMDDNLIYITVDTDKYNIVSYFTPFEIIGTHRNRKSEDKNVRNYAGCAVKYSFKNDREFDDIKVMTINLQDKKSKSFVRYVIYISINGDIEIEENVDTQKSIAKNFKGRSKNFQIKFNDNKVVTKLIITDEENKDTLETLLGKNVDKFTIFTFSKDYPDDEKDALKKLIEEKRYKAVTEYGVRLSPEYRRECKILYLFELSYKDETNFSVKCVKGN